MRHIKNNTEFKLSKSVVTLGKFDGIHLGHQFLINKVVSYKSQGYNAVMFTFSYNENTLLSNGEIELIYTKDEKVEKLKKTGLDVLISYPFTKKVMGIEAENFIKDILIDKLDAKIIVVGEDFRFGHKRKGDVSLLKQLEDSYGYKTIICKKVVRDGVRVSSSIIRDKISQGQLEEANALLGQPYTIYGYVERGKQIGRTLGIPTTNIVPASSKLLPPCGVYASKTILDGQSYPGITNIGIKPTVASNNARGVETFIFDFNEDLYGRKVAIELYAFQRPEIKFESLDKLKDAIEKDIESVKKIFSIYNHEDM